jgi:exonuclease SbcC
MGKDAAQYARIRLAQVLLSRAIKSYQDRTQAPLLQHASKWLSKLTGGRYVKLVVDYESERQIVLTERHDGTRLKNAELSDGTADQLYLALRLAAIQMRLSSDDPLPLVLDDVLLAFDEERVGHALHALASLAEDNQVILFTHHQHVVDLASKSLAAGSFAVQDLNT